LKLSLPEHAVAKVAAEILRGAQVDAGAAEHFGELGLHGGQREETGLAPRLELDQKIDVAVGAGGAVKGRAEDRETADVACAAVASNEPKVWFTSMESFAKVSYRTNWRGSPAGPNPICRAHCGQWKVTVSSASNVAGAGGSHRK
jgi:hypothetical protein